MLQVLNILGGIVISAIVLGFLGVLAYVVLWGGYREVFHGEESLDSIPSAHWRQVVEANNPRVNDTRYQ